MAKEIRRVRKLGECQGGHLRTSRVQQTQRDARHSAELRAVPHKYREY